MATPFFSIIIPTLNEEGFLPQLLQDLRMQRFPDFEVLIIDGHSTDNTQKIVRTLQKKDKRFRLIVSKKRNVSIQRNTGALHAKAGFLIFFDADSGIDKTFLSMLHEKIQMYPYDAWTTFAIPNTTHFSDQIYISCQNYLFKVMCMLGSPFSVGSCIGCRKEVFEKVGGFNPKTNYMEDSEFVQKIVQKKFKFHVFSKPNFRFSMRRYEKEGKVELLFKLFPHQVKALLNNNYEFDKSMYPMEGGRYYHRK